MKYRKSVYQSLVMITQFGVNMLVPIFLCSFLGIYMDKWFGTRFFMVIFFFMGALGGFRNIYILSKRIYEKQEKRDGHDKKDKTVK